MKNFPITLVVCIFVVATTVALLNGPPPVAAQTVCDASQLSSCAPAFLFGGNPNQECCTKLRAEQPCYCEYFGDPNLQNFVNSDAARRVAEACNITFPTMADCPN
ncbi:non-specific lipid-transfer protein 2P-like [Cucumis melo var. makuwa]|uniref:Non-specific lipid-transfer protein 2P-like n=2 Tax=Cucumis melo TaxID=3656 RepID=A0A5A7V7R4_CUCMM|nr:non-specific lipid-transfer protein 2P-like [Cucumis melo var. makuwa]TYK02866.1 non-specific lipid-transfer protein 2P-like [Cucumis melo var. makuwa]